jgi:protein-S-isoprenylcysteine O-methyltransferase
MGPPVPILPILLTVMVLVEAGLMRSRLSGDASRAADRGSLRMLFIVILGSFGLAWLIARSVPQARFDAVFGLDAATMRRVYWAGLGVFAAGVGLRWYSVAYLGRLFTYDVAIAADHRVVDTGPYRLIRHPAYAGSLLSFVGLGLCGGNFVSMFMLVLPITLAFLHRIAIEEAALRSALGSRYADYAGRTRRLVPFVY